VSAASALQLFKNIGKMEKFLRVMDMYELCSFLEEAGLHEDVIKSFSEKRINGVGFFSLNEEELKELIPAVEIG